MSCLAPARQGTTPGAVSPQRLSSQTLTPAAVSSPSCRVLSQGPVANSQRDHKLCTHKMLSMEQALTYLHLDWPVR